MLLIKQYLHHLQVICGKHKYQQKISFQHRNITVYFVGKTNKSHGKHSPSGIHFKIHWVQSLENHSHKIHLIGARTHFFQHFSSFRSSKVNSFFFALCSCCNDGIGMNREWWYWINIFMCENTEVRFLLPK